MSRLLPLMVLLTACSAAPIPVTVVPDPSPATSASPEPAPDTGDLGDADVVAVTLDGRTLIVAHASTAGDRAHGLRAVTDLGDLDGMLFSWGGETVTSRFNMFDTLIDLDIAFFDAAGAWVDGFPMVPCDTGDCPAYAASGPYAYALETPAGSQPTPGPDSVLSLPTDGP